MSLLDDTRDEVVLIPEIQSTDDLDNPVRVPDPDEDHWVTLHGRVQPSSSTEDVRDGQRVGTFYTFLCREFPAGAFARCVWNGRTWDVDGEPMRHNGSDTTRHATITFRARTAEAVA